jgi:serine/threonine-protein kinase HipA
VIARVHVHYVGGSDPVHVGDLAPYRGGIVFEYTPSFVATGLELSPFALPVSTSGLISGPDPRGSLEGLHGLFADSLPDGWGRLLMDRAFAVEGVDRTQITPLMRLTWLGSRAMGALTYEPANTPHDRPPVVMDLAEMSAAALRAYRGQPQKVLPELIRVGGSPGGARPKVLAGVRRDFDDIVTGDAAIPAGYRHWLIKFTTPVTGHDEGRIEAAYADMARAAGVRMPDTHLFTVGNRAYFGVARFDRLAEAHDRRRHVQTLAALMNIGLDAAVDYEALIRITAQLTRDHEAVCEIVRRMVFNILAHNRDDHAKNHAFVMEPDGTWSLTPAYDIGFTDGPSGEHALTVAGEGRAPTLAHVQTIATLGGVRDVELRAIVDDVRAAVAAWDSFSTRYAVPPARRRSIRKVLQSVASDFSASPPPRTRRR